MIASDSRESRVTGVEHFGVFSKPRTAFAKAKPAAPKSREEKPLDADPAVLDYTPTGSIAAKTPEMIGPGRPMRVFSGADGQAWIETAERGFIRPRIGDILPGFGRIDKITSNENSWVIVSDAGARLEGPVLTNREDRSRYPERTLGRGMLLAN